MQIEEDITFVNSLYLAYICELNKFQNKLLKNILNG
jgi:hypothetical protein